MSRARRLVGPLVATLLVVSACSGADEEGASSPSATRTPDAACVDAADEMDEPGSFEDDLSPASPDSPFDDAEPWGPPAAPVADDADVDRDRVQRVLDQPHGVWLTDPAQPAAQVRQDVARTVRAAADDRGVATLVVYGVPLRDCGGESGGGAESGEQYAAWTQAVADGLRDGRPEDGPGVAVVLEPDALAFLGRLPADRRRERLELLRAATSALSRVPSTAVYLDAGHSDWVEPDVMAERLADAGVAAARGFSVNVSGFGRTDDEVAYGRAISPTVGWKPFVVDTARNGNGPQDTWCNPEGAALGERPTSAPRELVDAFLWVKPPGESDGSCGEGQPPAGEPFPEQADRLAEAAGW
ncbi:glycoside hydrolase family 6 protein [Aeromicrobium sp. IC_218]|uniref:glycoside hydrolase family 6 protein n=1 Tax=Aeromicrobium sp. IC_218 TaxID=2545468 RepID=UPI00103F0F0D|nr:glycoside hydrolase family 6 protein [Aeromicrobium sp. IC_218]TCI95936.1 hypothetical protein E0W78_15545 [Aeromicrobium sp. IC_218]